MPAEGVPGFLNYRVVNRLTGAEVIHNLPHLHTSTWRVNAMQQGAPGSAAVGTFRIPLYPPLTDDYRANKAFYDQLDYGLRVEGYLGPVGAGAPRYAGIITGIKKGFNVYELSGFSDLWVLHKTRTTPGEISNWRTNGVLGQNGPFGSTPSSYCSGQNLTWGDDFTAYSAGNYTATGTWTTGSDSFASYIQCAAGTDSTLVSTTGALSTRGMVEASGVIATTSSDLTNAGMVGVVAGTKGARLVMRSDGAGAYNVDVQLVNNIGGTPGVDATAASVYTGQIGTFQFTIQFVDAVNSYTPATAFQYKVFLNGKDSGLFFNQGFNTGKPGLYFNAPATASATGQFYNLMGFHRATVIVGTGTVTDPSYGLSPSKLIGQLTVLDFWNQFATADKGYWRYTPGALPSSAPFTMGTVDYGATPGTDRSASIRFVEGDNLIDASIEPNTEVFATSVNLGSAQGTNSGGLTTWRNVAAMNSYGVLEDSVPVIPSSDFLALRGHAKQIIANKTALNNAKVITVLRDPSTADVWRDLDYVTVHAPTLGLNNVKALVLAYDFTEGFGTQQLWLDQFSGTDILARRLGSSVEYLGTRFTSR